MIYYFIIASFLAICYFYFIIILIKAWNKTQEYQKGWTNPFDILISVIIAARNEEENIILLLKSIEYQDFNKNNYEVIIIDDFSTDNTYNLVEKFCENKSNFNIYKLTDNFGKKNAIIKAINLSKGNLIVTTDADCIVNETWLSTIAGFYKKFKPKMIISPVLLNTTNKFSKIQALDFLSLISSAAATCGINKAILANGANLIYEKSVFYEFNNPLNESVSSGDDIFLLLNIKKKYPAKILFLKSNDAVVKTKAKKNLKSFLSQRKRWASKSKSYNDRDIISVSIFVFFVNLFLFINLVLISINLKFSIVFFIFFGVKTLVDFIFLYKTSSFFKQKKLLWFIIPTEIFNVVIIPFLAISGIFGKTFWKGRKI
ncbi:MAG: glycosyltransferase [Bacteroidales bacterium]|nr:glycosyltransferase [Bacteroidales bacterium]MBN2758120.1 glycosyltransferase [Bacteroidales bacterium]